MTDAAAILAIDGPHVLMIRSRKRHGSIELPCGALLPGESLYWGAHRELLEETGLLVNPYDLVPFHQKPWGDHRVHILRALKWQGELRAGDDAEGVFWDVPDALLGGAHPEDYQTTMRAMIQHKAAFGR